MVKLLIAIPSLHLEELIQHFGKYFMQIENLFVSPHDMERLMRGQGIGSKGWNADQLDVNTDIWRGENFRPPNPKWTYLKTGLDTGNNITTRNVKALNI